jgi:hypothetical protein
MGTPLAHGLPVGGIGARTYRLELQGTVTVFENCYDRNTWVGQPITESDPRGIDREMDCLRLRDSRRRMRQLSAHR